MTGVTEVSFLDRDSERRVTAVGNGPCRTFPVPISGVIRSDALVGSLADPVPTAVGAAVVATVGALRDRRRARLPRLAPLVRRRDGGSEQVPGVRTGAGAVGATQHPGQLHLPRNTGDDPQIRASDRAE